MNETIFIVGAELSSESKALRDRGYAGAFVNCVTYASDIPKALEKCSEALVKDGYVVLIFDSAYLYDSETDNHAEFLDAIERLKSGDEEVQYTPFSTYGH